MKNVFKPVATIIFTTFVTFLSMSSLGETQKVYQNNCKILPPYNYMPALGWFNSPICRTTKTVQHGKAQYIDYVFTYGIVFRDIELKCGFDTMTDAKNAIQLNSECDNDPNVYPELIKARMPGFFLYPRQ